jgi:O-antigen ligase/Tfp pilus assembly protein PilF
MSTLQLSSDDLPKYFLLLLYIITGTLSNFGAIDILAPQWIYLGSINLLSAFYFLFFSKNKLDTAFYPLFKTSFIYIYLFYVVWNAFSYFYAINPVETAINLPRLFNVFSAIFFCYFLIYNLPNKFFFISRLFLFFLVAELLAFYNDFFGFYGTANYSAMVLKGFAGNKNITAASIAFKVPFLLYLLSTLKHRFSRVLVFGLLFGSILAISLIDARAAILSSIIVFVLFLCFQLYAILSKQLPAQKGLLALFTIIAPYLLAFVMNGLIASTTSGKTLTNSIGQIAFTEESSNGRFQYWGDAFDYVKDNPIFASGLGNWKIASISYGKDHISGYTVPYHAHNDFIHVFTESGILGGIAYLALFAVLTFYLFVLLYNKFKNKGVFELQYFFLLLPLIVYGIDAGLNFPVARPLMQSSLAIFAGLILSLYLDVKHKEEAVRPIKKTLHSVVLGLFVLALIPSLSVHIISFKSLQKQGQLLYEFNNAKFNLTRAQLDEISHDFPNLTETAMPIKAMKARYYYLQGNKEEAFQMIDEGIKDNPQIYFGENLKAQYLLQENKLDSAYVYAKRAFEGLPNNMPHYDIYMRTMVLKKDYQGIDAAFNRVQPIAGDTKTVWLIYIRSLAQTRSLGDSFAMDQAAKAYALFPEDETIFLLYRILTYGQPRIVEAEQIFKNANEAYTARDFNQAAQLFKQAFDLDPLQPSYCLNTGLAFYEGKQFDNAIEYFDLAIALKKSDIVERAQRYKGLSLYQAGRGPEACAVFIKLRNAYPKRMYQQEFQKYCLGKKEN